MGEDERETAPGTGPGRLAGRPPAPGACDVEVAPGAVRVTVPDPGGGPFRVEIPVETHPAQLKRSACTLFLKKPKWRAALEIGHPPDLGSLARAVAKATGLGPPRLELGRAACDCGARPGRCRHAKVAVEAARGTLSGFPVRQLRARGFDVEEWARSPECEEAAGTPRRLTVCWRRAWETWEARPLEEMPDLAPIPRLLEKTVAALTPTPFGFDFDDTLRDGMAAAAERAGWLRDRADPAVTLDSLGPLDVTVNVNGEVATLSGRDEYRPGVGHQDYTAWLAAGHGGRGSRLVNALAQVVPEQAGRLGATERYWAMLFRYVEALTLRGALAPELVLGRTDESRKFLWRPATMLSGSVRDIHRRFVDACPPDLLRMREIQDPARLMRASRETQVRHAVDLLFRGILGWDDDESAPGRPDLCEKGRNASVAVFGLGPLWQHHFDKTPDDWEILEWLRRLSIPATLSGMVMELAPDPDDPDVIGGGVVFVDADDNPMPLGDVLDRECSVWHLLALDSLSGFLGVDLELQTESTGVDIAVPIGDFPEFLLDVSALTGRIRVRLAVSGELGAMKPARICHRMSARGGRGAAKLDLAALAHLDWKVGVGDKWFDPGEFETLVKEADKQTRERDGCFDIFGKVLFLKPPPPVLKRLGGEYVLLGHEFVFSGFSASPPGPTDGLSHLELLRAAVSGEHHGAAVEPDPSARRLLDEALSPRERPDPPGALAGVLWPHQREGFEWLAHNADIGFGSVLADDTGLGKTLQAIALILHRTRRDPAHKTLVAAPTALLTHWAREIRRFAPGLRTQVRRAGSAPPDPGRCDVVVASHGTVGKDADALGARAWGLLVVDEAQKLGNPATLQAKAIKGCKADARVALTGIPVGDRPDDCWAILDHVNPGYLWSRREFRRELARPIERQGEGPALARFRRLVGPFVLRRTKTDKGIAKDVPGKEEAP